jgi:hypothetical protein
MPLIQCPVCGNDVPPQAASCPNCAKQEFAAAVSRLYFAKSERPRDQRTGKTPARGKIALLLFIIVLINVGVVVVIGGHTTKTTSSLIFGLFVNAVIWLISIWRINKDALKADASSGNRAEPDS